MIKSPEKHYYASKFTKNLSFTTTEGDILIQIQKWRDAIIYTFFQYLSTDKIYPPYKSLRAENHNISKFIPPTDTHPKFST